MKSSAVKWLLLEENQSAVFAAILPNFLSYLVAASNTVWTDLAKFCQGGKYQILRAIFCMVYLVFVYCHCWKWSKDWKLT